MSLKHGILGLLLYKSMSGYELDKTFKESLNFFWTAQASQIYRELNQMEKQQLLTSELILQTGKPNKKIYSITPNGEELLHIWLSQENSNDSVLRNTFLVRIFFSGEQTATQNIQTIKKYRQNCINELKKLEQSKQVILNYAQHLDDIKKSMYWQLTSDFGKSYFEMCVNWADNTLKKLEEIA